MKANLEPERLASRIVRAAGAGELAVRQQKGAVSIPLGVFGIKLGALRRRKGMALDELAEKAQVDADLLFAIELGLASFRQVQQHLRPIGDALGGAYPYLSRLLIQLVLDGTGGE